MRILRLLGLVLLCATLAGCVKYRITLSDGTHFTVLGKPKYDEENNVYRYKAGGKERVIAGGRVSSVEPSSEADDWNPPSSGNSDWNTKN